MPTSSAASTGCSIPRKIHRPREGVAVYFEPTTGAAVLLTHHIADPLKRSVRWRKETATDPAFAPEGENSPQFAEEYDMSFTAARAKLIYYRWDERYTLVEPFDIREKGFSRVCLSFDFGDHTACGFYAQNPRTSQSVAFDELYWYKETIATMQADVYRKLSDLFGLRVGEFRANEVVEDIIGDPHGPGVAREFGEGSLPVTIRTKSFNLTVRLEDHLLGWAKVNGCLAPGFWHCGKRQTPKGGVLLGKCAFCGRERPASPLFVVMKGKCPNLERTVPLLEKQETPEGEVESDKEKRGQEDHFADEMRYYVMRTSYPEVQGIDRDILKEPISKLTVGEKLARIREESFMRQKREQDEGLRDDFGRVVVMHGDDGTDYRLDDASFVDRSERSGAGFYDDDD